MNNPRLWLAIWILVILAILVLNGQSRGYVIAIGKVQPTEQESGECYFPLSNAASINLHPDGEPCKFMRTMIGKTGTLFFIPDQ